MVHVLLRSRALWLAVGLVAGLSLGGVLPEVPLHAVATNSNDTFAIATGPLDQEVEAVFFLDHLTGNLNAFVLNKLGAFNAFFNRNVLGDLQVNPAQNPRFLMVTGVANLQRTGAAMQPGQSICYVAEITTGRVAAYAVPWNAAMRNRTAPMQTGLLLLGVMPFRATAGPGPATPAPATGPDSGPAKKGQ